ncbi:MAG: dephospho-CoA kinase [Ignavibacteriales bacterium]|nr:dephospho-CoA kinase [Ignavibacteriales bacterium]
MSGFRVGVTGGVGAGKSAACEALRCEGYRVFDGDKTAREALETDADARAAIIKAFGEESYREGKLNAPFVARLVFSDDKKLRTLNAVAHPLLKRELDRRMAEAPETIVFAEAAILFEGELASIFDKIVVIAAPDKTRLERTIARDGAAREDVLARMNAQIPQDEKIKRADYVIANDGTLDELREKIRRLGDQLARLAKERSQANDASEIK